MPYADGQCGSTCFDDFRLLSRLTVGVVRHVASDRCAWMTPYSEVGRSAVNLPYEGLTSRSACNPLTVMNGLAEACPWPCRVHHFV